VAGQAQTLSGNAAERFYGSVFLGWQSTSIDGSSFDTRLANVAGGVWLWEGIGVEAEFGFGYSEDSISGLRLEIPAQTMVNLRLESPPTSGYSAFVQAGVAHTEIDSRFATNTTAAGRGSLSSSLTGYHVGVGLALQVNRWLIADAGYSRLLYEDDSGVNLFRLGVRIFPGRVR
jgi:opacity protein-like surface antigen